MAAINEALARIEAGLLELRGLRTLDADIQAIRKVLASRAPEQRAFLAPDAAKVLGIGLTKLRSLVASGAITTVFIGRSKMIPLSEIERLTTPGPVKQRRPRRPKLPDPTQNPAGMREWLKQQQKKERGLL